MKTLTVKEAGRKGGLKTKELGKEHYQKAQKKSVAAKLKKKNAKK